MDKTKILNSYNREYLKNIFSFMRMMPSLHIGGSTYHSLFPRRASVILYITNRCNSRCITCNHWQQTPKHDLSLEIIEDLKKSKALQHSSFLVEGGEALLHPEFEEILARLQNRNVHLLTNGILTDKISEFVTNYKIPAVSISLDGGAAVYKHVRGVDAYDKVLKTIDLLKNKTSLGINFTISKWNTYDDYSHVRKLCETKKISLHLGVFAAMDYMGVTNKEALIDTRYERMENPYISLYNNWVNGQNSPPCFAMRVVTIIRPNGDVALCQHKDIILGNLYERSFDEIWNDSRTKEVQRAHRFCNDCWVASHRSFDVKFKLLMEKVFPSALSNSLLEKI